MRLRFYTACSIAFVKYMGMYHNFIEVAEVMMKMNMMECVLGVNLFQLYSIR